MIMKALPLVALIALLLGGCRTTLPPMALEASPETLEALKGDWFGTYTGIDSGRHGTIAFLLSTSPDSAFGDVIMEAEEHDWTTHDPTYAALRRNHSERIRIDFVRIDGNRITGQLEPYDDPECGCSLITVFHGTIEGDKMSGTFTSRHGMSDHVDEGRWSARRRS